MESLVFGLVTVATGTIGLVLTMFGIGRASTVFIRNGAQLYLDVDSHPKYAAPSATTSWTLSCMTRRASGSWRALLVDADRRLREEGFAGDIYLFKNNTDSAGNSYGCHENYLVGKHGEFGRLADILIPFLVCGEGKVLTTFGVVLTTFGVVRTSVGNGIDCVATDLLVIGRIGLAVATDAIVR